MEQPHVLRFLESKQTAADHLITQLSNLLIRISNIPPDTIPTRVWHSIACIEASLWKYLCIPDPSLEEYLSMVGLLQLLEYRLTKFFPSTRSSEPPTLPSVTTLEPLVQRWIPRSAPELDPALYEKYRLLVKPEAELGARYLVGIADAFVHASTTDFRALVQALCRKRNEIELPTTWPIPNYVHTDRTDPLWFVWGLLMHLWPKKNQQWLMTKFKIFTYNYKGKTTKLNRLGILCCVEQRMAELLATFAPCEEALEFSVADLHMIETCIENGVAYAEKMNRQLTHTAPKKDVLDEEVDRVQKEIFYMNFIPRKSEEPRGNYRPSSPTLPESKYIDID